MKIVLTGSIGMGKSTVAKMFADFGFELWSADEVVKSLYKFDLELRNYVRSVEPRAIIEDVIDFDLWRKVVRSDTKILPKLEAILHPKVCDDRIEFLKGDGRKLCEIPLYFETGRDGDFDAVVVVSASLDIQKARVLARGTMNSEDFERIRARQIPDAQKRELADFVIQTNCSLEETRMQVQKVIEDLESSNA